MMTKPNILRTITWGLRVVALFAIGYKLRLSGLLTPSPWLPYVSIWLGFSAVTAIVYVLLFGASIAKEWEAGAEKPSKTVVSVLYVSLFFGAILTVIWYSTKP